MLNDYVFPGSCTFISEMPGIGTLYYFFQHPHRIFFAILLFIVAGWTFANYMNYRGALRRALKGNALRRGYPLPVIAVCVSEPFRDNAERDVAAAVQSAYAMFGHQTHILRLYNPGRYLRIMRGDPRGIRVWSAFLTRLSACPRTIRDGPMGAMIAYASGVTGAELLASALADVDAIPGNCCAVLCDLASEAGFAEVRARGGRVIHVSGYPDPGAPAVEETREDVFLKRTFLRNPADCDTDLQILVYQWLFCELGG
jgi:hypothetical protein